METKDIRAMSLHGAGEDRQVWIGAGGVSADEEARRVAGGEEGRKDDGGEKPTVGPTHATFPSKGLVWRFESTLCRGLRWREFGSVEHFPFRPRRQHT